MATTTPGRRTSYGAIGAGMAMLAFAALSSPAGAADNPTAFTSNISCADLGLAEFKIDEQPAEGTYTTTSDHVTTAATVSTAVPSDLEIEISNVVADADSVTFDWHATTDDGDFSIDVVLVKFANGGLRWDYAQPGESSDTAWSTQDSISHVSFCFDADTGSTDGTTDAGTTDTGTTDTGTTDTGTTDTGTTDTGDSLGATTGATDDTEVLGNTVTRGGSAAAPETLPATGAEDMSLAIAGAALIGLGSAGLVLSARLRRANGTHVA